MKKTGKKIWKRYSSGIDTKEAVYIEGDKSVPKTRWWNHLWLLLYRWRTVAIFEIVHDDLFYVGYQPGFRTIKDEVYVLQNHEVCEKRFGMLIGHEACEFFVLLKNTTTCLKLKLVVLTTKDDPKYKDVVLY